MQLTKLNMALIGLLVLQSFGLVVLANRMPTPIPEQRKPQYPEAMFDEKISSQALTQISNIVDAAVERGQWTENDGIEIKEALYKTNPEDRAKAYDKIGDAVNQQTFDPDKPVILPFDYF